MIKAREILRLKNQVGLSLREIAGSCSCGKTTVSEVLERAKKAGITDAANLSDKQLLSILYPPAPKEQGVPEPDIEYVFKELKKKNVTLMLLWEEYKQKHPDGVMYTQFCERYRNFKIANKLEMHKEHKAGEEMEVDWAGTTMSYFDISSGQTKKAYIFVSVLPASNYPFIYAYKNMKSESWLDAHERAFKHYGGTPRILIPDNTKTAVLKADIYDPVLTKSYYEMASHYGVTIVPARPNKAKDKASVENAVGNVSRKIIAALRNRKFFSLNEINIALASELSKFTEKPFQKMQGSRKSTFLEIDKPKLRPLPKNKYEFATWKESKIPFNYHVEYEGFFYSTPFQNIGENCSIRATSRTIEVFTNNECIAAHPRNYNVKRQYTTLELHMPEKHKVVSEWNDERFLKWAARIGPFTKELIGTLLSSYDYSVQSYRACMGILRLAGDQEAHIVEAASEEALERKTISYKYFNIILKKVVNQTTKGKEKSKVIAHDNLRGPFAFERGGLNA